MVNFDMIIKFLFRNLLGGNRENYKLVYRLRNEPVIIFILSSG